MLYNGQPTAEPHATRHCCSLPRCSLTRDQEVAGSFHCHGIGQVGMGFCITKLNNWALAIWLQCSACLTESNESLWTGHLWSEWKEAGSSLGPPQIFILSIGQLTAECHRKTMQQKCLPLEDAAFSQTAPFYLPIYIENKEAMYKWNKFQWSQQMVSK